MRVVLLLGLLHRHLELQWAIDHIDASFAFALGGWSRYLTKINLRLRHLVGGLLSPGLFFR